MYTPNSIAKRFFECFDGSAVTDFKRFIDAHPDVDRWMIAADFALHDPTRFNDCYAFTIFPYNSWPADLEREITTALPKDLKKSKDLEADAVKWLRDDRAYHLAIKVSRERSVFYNGEGSDPLSVAREHVNMNVEAALAAGKDASRFKKLKQEAQAKGFNHELLADIWLLGLFYALVTVSIGRERLPAKVMWAPDRDNMTTWCDGVWTDYAYYMLHTLCEAMELDMRETEVLVAKPDTSGPKERMWYDHMIRGADWFAGVVAAWDIEKNLIPGEHAKYKTMTEQVIADATNSSIINMTFEKQGVRFGGIAVTRKADVAA